LKETKLSSFDQTTARHLGGHHLDKFFCKPAGGPSGTRGGIALLWDTNHVELTDFTVGDFHISGKAKLTTSHTAFLLTVVYGPTSNSMKTAFLQEIQDLKPQSGIKWLLLGDFNLIYKASDKNKRRLNLSLMNRFSDMLDCCDLKEINLQNRRFTWSNERTNPTLIKLDTVFANAEWDQAFHSHVLHGLSSSLSDHCPLLLSNQTGPRRPRSFKFENFWAMLLGFMEVVSRSWCTHCTHQEPFRKLYHKLQATARALRQWSFSTISDAKLQLHMALEIIHRFDIAQELRALSPGEELLRCRLKKRILGLAVIERAWKKQAARLNLIKFGDANTRFFHRRITSRRQKNFIHCLKDHYSSTTTHEGKAAKIQSHFENMLSRPPTPRIDFNRATLGLQHHDLSSLVAPFSEEEIKRAIDLLPIDKALGPDGFTGLFFKTCWSIIKGVS
jgi:exonuclease III